MHRRSPGTLPSASVLWCLTLLGCGEGDPIQPAVGPPAAFTTIGGDEQSGPVGTLLPQPLAVRLTDASGTPLPGYPVAFVVTSGEGTPFVPTVETDSAGEARNRWTLGPDAAAEQRLEARLLDPGTGATFSLTFTSRASPGPLARLTLVEGDAQAAIADHALPAPLTVRAADAFGNPLEGVVVTWTVTAGGGTLDTPADTTDGTGEASARWTVGADPTVPNLVRAATAADSVDLSAFGCAQLRRSGASCFYPRAGTPTVDRWFTPNTTLPVHATTGTRVGIFDVAGRGENEFDETIAVARSLDILAVPYEVFDDASRAGDFEFVELAGTLRPGDLSAGEITAFESYVGGGGVLLLHNVADPALHDLAGVLDDRYEPLHSELRFEASGDPLEAYLDHPAERLARYGDGVVPVAAREYTCAETVLARYEDDTHAICGRLSGPGAVYTFGIRPKTLQLLRQIGRTGGLELPFTNHFNPVADLPTLMLRGIYEARASNPSVRSFLPPGFDGVLVVTHDIDAASSIANLSRYQAFEVQQGVRATYFMQTPAHPTGYTTAFYTPDAVDLLRTWPNHFDIGSHSYGHFLDFDRCPLTSASDTPARYYPTLSGGSATDCSVFGETGVSRYLLEMDLGVTIEHFRAGHLVRPERLDATLAELGYRRASELPSGTTGATFPFVTFDYDNPTVNEHALVEYPLSISDNGLDETTVDQTVAAWTEVLAANAANGAPTVLLVHPSDRPGRFEAFRQFMLALDDGRYWITDLKSFADYWESQGVVGPRE